MSFEGSERRRDGIGEQVLAAIRDMGTKVDGMNSTLVEHNTKIDLLFGNGQPGIITKFNERIGGLEKFQAVSVERDQRDNKDSDQLVRDVRDIKEKVAKHDVFVQQETGARRVWHIVTSAVGLLVGWIVSLFAHGRAH